MYELDVRSEGARERVGQFQSWPAALMAIRRTQPKCTRAGRLDEEQSENTRKTCQEH